MKAVLLILIGILLIAMFFLLQENRRITFQMEQQQQEIKASGEYIRILNSRLLENEITEESPEDKDNRIRELLAAYLNEKQSAGSESYVQARKIEREKLFIPDLLPIKGDFQISQGFKTDHQGLDFAAPLGREVLAAAAGLVTAVYRDKYFGNVIEIDHLNGFITAYAHLAKVLVGEEDLVKKGMTVGLVGDTGNSSAPHLHFEIIRDNNRIDPRELIKLN